MKTQSTLCFIIFFTFFVSCEKERSDSSFRDSESFSKNGTLCFASVEELSNYAELISNSSQEITSKAGNSFISLWDSQQESVISSFTPDELLQIEKEGLIFEPEDEIIPDPIFARILSPQREVIVGGEIYRYVKTGVIIFNEFADKEIVDKFDADSYRFLQDKEEITIADGIKFIRLHYQQSLNVGDLETKAPTIDPGLYSDKLVLKNGVSIPISDVRMVEYAQGNGDANGFQKAISSIFGTNVVAENYFDSNHRMKLRTFAQDFIIYTSVGMTVRMQKKTLGIWWRIKAQEFRYGWTAVECYYTYNGPSFPQGITFQNASVLTHDYTNYYQQPLVLFSVPLVDYQVTNKTISALLKSLLEKNQSKINTWLNDNPSYKSSPYSFFSADKAISYSMIFPQNEEVATDDGREQINWDFRVHFQTGVKIGSGGVSPTFSPVGDPEKIEIRRGDIYAAVKFDNHWKACVISAK